jgi:protein-S-isoprenylcysteine O-methyltransferase Ste14
MDDLKLRVPPPAVAVLIAGAMWGISLLTPPLYVPSDIRWAVALAVGLAGVGIALSGVVSFVRARTTVNPMKPMKTSALVTTGVYRFSRNPMYVGVLFVLIAWAVILSVAWVLAGPVVFVLYMERFQIAPEERALSDLFGEEYAAYKARVRRWL